MTRRSIFLLPLLAAALWLAGCGQRGGQGDATAPSAAPTTELAAPADPAATPTTPAVQVSDEPVAVSSIALPPAGTDGFPWWNDTVWYEVFVRSFYDSDGDGIGDLQGLIQKLDYLNDGDPATTTDLGITGIWLMPVAESPSYHGYDVVDYLTIEQDYGTNEDFEQFMDEAHRRGIRVVVDLVLNHTSSEHPWFEAARAGDEELEEWYVFHEGERPVQYAPWGGSNIWHQAGPDRSYYGIFWSEMPDLNYRNPDVTAEMHEVTRFWLEDMGVDGFRLDAIRHLIETGEEVEHTDETHAWLEDYHELIKGTKPEAFVVGEVWSSAFLVAPYIGDELDVAFEFDTATNLINSARGENAFSIRQAYAKALELYEPGQFAPFIANHDQNRAFTQFRENVDYMRTASAMLLTGPGTPFLYYGEEVGMTGAKPDEDIRRPFPWTGDEGGGFTTGRPWRDLPEGWEERNVAAMEADPDSLLNWYRALIRLRNDHEALRIGDMLILETDARPLFAFLRQSNDETLLVLHNLGDEPLSDYTLALEEGSVQLADGTPVELLHEADATAPTLDGDGRFSDYRPIPTLEPFSTYIIQLRP